MRVAGPAEGTSPCHHAETVNRLQPPAPACAGCVARGADWAGLLVCLACGWVACSDESPNQHARGHYQETDHPVATTYEPSDWRWCYVHQRVV
jgi:uncharacterized UBP type Zn finger protein